MTENQWTNVTGSSSQDPEATTIIETTPSATPASGSKKDAVKEEASNVAGHAATAAQGVAQTAKEEAANVASEAKSSAKDLLSQAKSGLSSQAGTQQQKVAEGIRTVSSQLQTMAEAPEQQGLASDLIRQAAQRTETVASWIENKEPGDLLSEVQRFARNRPGTFLLLAAGAGLLAGRLTRSLAAGAADSGSGASQPQRQVPASQAAALPQETGYATGSGTGLYEEPVVIGAATASTTTLPSGTAEEMPLRFEDDLYQRGEGRHL
ncbi:hypothetical protein [Pseudarthrobacter sp. NamB4]|uniref:hypothetical protein n=1 Tax=Pseudarthrobacter sp. NamB4 TaxID=2576837 RepID=UPI001F0D2DDC|nr:hypothetical protein [Pseudarthrobacter sp. NamB4]